MERKGAASLIGPQRVLVTGNWQLHRKKKKQRRYPTCENTPTHHMVIHIQYR